MIVFFCATKKIKLGAVTIIIRLRKPNKQKPVQMLINHPFLIKDKLFFALRAWILSNGILHVFNKLYDKTLISIIFL